MREKRDPLDCDSHVRARAEENTRQSADADPIDRARDGTTTHPSPPPGVLERIDDPVYALDAECRLTYANEAAQDLFEFKRGAVEDGDGVREGDSSPKNRFDASPFEGAHERALERGRPETVEEFYEPTGSWLEAVVYPSETGVTVHVRDVSERVERERALEEGNRRFRAIFEDASDAIVLGDEDGISEANPAACELFGVDRNDLRGRSLAEFMRNDRDFRSTWEAFLEIGRRRGAHQVCRPDGTERLAEYDAVADVLPGTHLAILRDVTDVRHCARTLERQRERLAALDHINTVVREINTAIVDGSTREELERITCRALADSPSYEFAFVAEASTTTDAVSNRVEAGVDGYVDAIPLSTDGDEPAGRGPAGRAIRTQTIQVSTDVFSDPDFEPWREDARERGYRSAAAIPIVYDGSLYGILGVTSARANAFTNEERDVLAQLGETVGHAIAALERRRVLLGESVLEIELVIDDATAVFDGPAMEGQSVLFDRVVRVGDEEFLEYGTTDRETYPAVEELVDCVPHWKDVTVLDESGERVTFELQISSPPMFSVVDAHDGYVDAAAIHDGDYTTTLHLPPGTDVRAVLEEIREVYPSARTLARRQRSFERASVDRLQEQLSEKLTPRQRTALETAYAAGYFEWPRNSSGEDVAETLGVTPATFHEHLRAAQEKLLESVLDETDELEE